ncbi:SigE family RNA polymerase sigma factor [Micromonospora sp. RB23]
MTRSGAMVADPVARRAVPATSTRSRPEDPAEAEFCAFVRARAAALQRSAFLLTGDRHLAEDLVQDALARTHRALRRLADSGHFEAYTRIAMYHLHARRWRRTRIAESLPGELADLPHPDSDHAGRTDLKLSLLRALDQLTRRQRAVLVLRFFDDRSEAEAAEMLSCSIGTVKSQTSKALARLRQIAPELLSATETNGVPR